MKSIINSYKTLKGRFLFSTLLALISMALLIFLYGNRFESISLNQAYTSFEVISNEIEKKIYAGFNEIDRAARIVSYSPTVQNYILASNPIKIMDYSLFAIEMMNMAVSSTDKISNITIILRDNRKSFFYNSTMQETLWQALYDYKSDNVMKLKKPYFSKVYYNNKIENKPYCYYFFPIYNVLPGNFDKDNIAICAVLCDLRLTAGDIGNGMIDNSVIILKYNNQIISSSRVLNSNELDILNNLQSGRGEIRNNGINYFTNTIIIPEVGWEFINIISENDLTKEIIPLRITGMIIMISSIVLISIIMILALNSVTHPIKQIINEIKSIENKEEKYRITIPKSYEISYLAKSINILLNKIETTNQTNNKTQQSLFNAILAQQKAELLSYRSQINPHFLFNTLECMRSIAHENSVKCIEILCNSMAQMFHYSLHSEPIVCLKDEIKHLRNYLYVMSVRYPDLYSFKCQFMENALMHPIQSMILQPIVENSILHGFKGKIKNCIIVIKGYIRNDGKLVLQIIDNGSGISSEKVEIINNIINGKENIGADQFEDESIGLININQRMRYSFGELYQFKVKSVIGHYTHIELIIPGEIQKEI